MIKVGVIGYGYWGPNLVRNFFESDQAWVSAICDRKLERMETIGRRYPTIRTTAHVEDILKDRTIDAVAISTPIQTHFRLAMKALKAGKHVLVEKPMTGSLEEAERLVEEARKRKRILMVDHTFVYTGAVRWMRDTIQAGSLGKLHYYDSVRVNLGLFQHDVNVIWDLAPHDISIMRYLLDRSPDAVMTTGMATIKGQPESIAYITCYFADNLLAHFHVNWHAPAKIRLTMIGGDRRMIVYDDAEIDQKIKLYNKGVVASQKRSDLYERIISYRLGNMVAPKLDNTEALKKVTAHFLECIEKGKRPLTDGRVGLEVVRILEAASESLKKKGKLIRLR
jgi:predicted dehydrogenase